MLCCVMLCYVMLCYVMLCYAMLCYAMLCYAMLCYAMLCYAMLCYVMLCYVMYVYSIQYVYIYIHYEVHKSRRTAQNKSAFFLVKMIWGKSYSPTWISLELGDSVCLTSFLWPCEIHENPEMTCAISCEHAQVANNCMANRASKTWKCTNRHGQMSRPCI